MSLVLVSPLLTPVGAAWLPPGRNGWQCVEQTPTSRGGIHMQPLFPCFKEQHLCQDFTSLLSFLLRLHTLYPLTETTTTQLTADPLL